MEIISTKTIAAIKGIRYDAQEFAEEFGAAYTDASPDWGQDLHSASGLVYQAEEQLDDATDEEEVERLALVLAELNRLKTFCADNNVDYFYFA